MLQSDAIDQLAAALASVQIELTPVTRDKKVATRSFDYSYASLSVILELVQPILSRHGLAVTQTVVPRVEPILAEHVETKVDRNGSPIELRYPVQSLGSLRTVLVHTSGQWIASELPILAPWGDVQEIGARVTYYRRIALKAIVGLAEVDETDGKAQSDTLASKTPTTRGKYAKATQTDPRTVAQRMAQVNSGVQAPAPESACPTNLRRFWKARGLESELIEFVQAMGLRGRASQWSDEERRKVHEGMSRAYADEQRF
jgi:hypothetical protein